MRHEIHDSPGIFRLQGANCHRIISREKVSVSLKRKKVTASTREGS